MGLVIPVYLLYYMYMYDDDALSCVGTVAVVLLFLEHSHCSSDTSRQHHAHGPVKGAQGTGAREDRASQVSQHPAPARLHRARAPAIVSIRRSPLVIAFVSTTSTTC